MSLCFIGGSFGCRSVKATSVGEVHGFMSLRKHFSVFPGVETRVGV